MSSIKKTIEDAQNCLSKNTEWIERYSGYALNILANLETIRTNRRQFNQFTPLYFYILTSKATNAKSTLELDVRYKGQSVATLRANKNKITLSTQGKDVNNLRDYDCNIRLDKVEWKSMEASQFRTFFKNKVNARNNVNSNKNNEEHHVESLLLNEFSKLNGKNKQIVGIQPVKIGGAIFGMPTPLKASDHNLLSYSGHRGGGIDILARTGGGRSTYLTVIEVKDENKEKEPPEDALKQAIQYAVFIRELLRSESGKEWYQIFGFTGNLPKKITIKVSCAMPDDFSEKSFAKQTYNVGDDVIECHYIYFKYNGKSVIDFQSSFSK